MKKKYILFLLISFFTISLSAQTLEQARNLYANKEYEKAAPIFEKYVKSQPTNGNYNLWYGVCCLETGRPAEAVKYLETAVKRRVASGQLYLAQAYNNVYRYEDAIQCYEEYIEALKKRKQPTEEAEKLLDKSKADFRMFKGVEEVCVIDSFVVDKASFLQTYKISEESGKLYTFDEYFKVTGNHPGTVYETELGNKLYYSETGKDDLLNIFSKNKLIDEWSKGTLLPENINATGNTNYPFVLTDGITIYYASDGAGSIGGYDIFVTRYNTNTDTYLTPENVGMPFNSPFNDYMYVIDEYNNLGWFASDRYQPEGKVCVYVFIPNSSKRIYNYESTPHEQMVSLAQLRSLKDTWKDKTEVQEALQRLESAINHKPQERQVYDFVFVIDDQRTYHQLSDFRSKQAQEQFQLYQRMEKDFKQQESKLDQQRQAYTKGNKEAKAKLTPAILDLEKRVRQMSLELDEQAIKVRSIEKQ
ncbi:tetratricopeptide repeat protein [Bacteroides sp.]|uniref:tetratricopeptide repeat protein n=1 Tax=Bacteroides sp. TaxID=29523 RepID=UPI002FC61405